jgi:hypothetical protein
MNHVGLVRQAGVTVAGAVIQPFASNASLRRQTSAYNRPMVFSQGSVQTVFHTGLKTEKASLLILKERLSSK